jgi:hypothetical protein
MAYQAVGLSSCRLIKLSDKLVYATPSMSANCNLQAVFQPCELAMHITHGQKHIADCSLLGTPNIICYLWPWKTQQWPWKGLCSPSHCSRLRGTTSLAFHAACAAACCIAWLLMHDDVKPCCRYSGPVYSA